MRTPEGWARANLLLVTLQTPPPEGSLQESVLILLLMKQESIEHARFRASAQITLDKEKGVEAFEEYMKIAFPYLEASKRRDRDKYLEALNKEVKMSKSGLLITAQQTPKVRSRLASRIARRKTPLSKEKADNLYRRLKKKQ